MQIIIFDMDGTLIDSRHDIAESINFARKQKGLEPLSEPEITRILNDPAAQSAKALYGTDGYSAADRENFESHYHRQCLMGLKLFEGIAELLETLANQNIRMAIATNASRAFAERMLAHARVDRFFETMIGASCVPRPKPHPDMLYEVFKRLDYRPSEGRALFVGDSAKDMLSAKAAGIEGVFVRWGYGECGGHADRRIDSPGELLGLL